MLGRWYGKTRRMMLSIQRDLEKELNLIEMKEQVQQELDQIRALERDMQQQLVEMKKHINIDYSSEEANIQKTEQVNKIETNEYK
ncbi:hypothetical protein Q4247_16880 [Acinetobacter baumannii]